MYNYNEKLTKLEQTWHIAKSNHTRINNALKSKEGLLYEFNNKSTLGSNNMDFLSILNRIEDVIELLWREEVGNDKWIKVEDEYLEDEDNTKSFCEYIIENYKDWRQN